MKKLLLIYLLLLFSTKIFCDEYIRKDGSRVVVNESLPAVIGKTGHLEVLGEELDYWERYALSLNKDFFKQKIDLNIFIYIKNSKLIFQIDVINSDIENRLYYNGERVFYVKSDMPFYYFQGIDRWFYKSHEESSYYGDLVSLEPLYIFNYVNSNGMIQFHGVKQYRVIQISNYFIKCGPYTIKLRNDSGLYGYDKQGPKYNPIDSTYTDAYFIAYLFSDYPKLMDLPVPSGLDYSFKNDWEKIPLSIEHNEWELFARYVKKYKLKLNPYIDLLIEKKAPVSVLNAFTEGEIRSVDFSQKIQNLLSKNEEYISLLYRTFDENEINILRTILSDKINENPISVINFFVNQNISIKKIFDSIPNNILQNCTKNDIQKITNDYDIIDLAPLLSKIDSDKQEIILQNRKDNVSKFLKFFYFNFDSISLEIIDSFTKDLEISVQEILTSKIYGIEKTIAERLTEKSNSEVLQDFFDKGVLKIILKNSNDIRITTDFAKDGVCIPDYNNCDVLLKILNNAIFETSYKLFSNELSIENLFYPQAFLLDNCIFSLQFDDGINYLDSKKKSGVLLFGELKNNKWIRKNINIRNNENETLLFTAIKKNNNAFAQQLIKEGIDVSIRNLYGQTALDIAKSQNNITIQKILEKKLQ